MHAKLALLAPLLLAGCPDRTIAGVPVDQTRVETKSMPGTPRRDLDILFLIDSSRSMEEEQESLRANFDRFITVLESLDGGLPNVQIGVATPDLGSSATNGTNAGANVGGCTARGLGGELRALPGTNLRFLRDVDDGSGGRIRNFTGTLQERFAELADVGIDGCGIEQHLESVKRVLDGNPVNAGFLRPNAYLAVIVVADEDDCSLAQSSLFEGNTGDPQWGDKVNFRCTRDGIVCDNPSGPLTTVGRRENCRPDPASTMLTSLDRYVEFLKSLKANPKDVMVAGIIGDAGPFEIHAPNGTPVLKPSCIYEGPTGDQFAFPGLRLGHLISQFPQRNSTTTICDEDLSEGLTEIGAMIAGTLGDPCFRSQLSDVDPETDGAQYECSVTEVRERPNGPPEDLRVIPACDATASRLPCFRIEEDPVQCKFVETNPKLKLVIERGGVAPEAGVAIQASCVTTASSGMGVR